MPIARSLPKPSRWHHIGIIHIGIIHIGIIHIGIIHIGIILASYSIPVLREPAATDPSPARSAPTGAPTHLPPARHQDRWPRQAGPLLLPARASRPQVGRFEGTPAVSPGKPPPPPRWRH